MDSDRGLRVRKALIGFVALLLIAQFARTMAAELIPGDPVPVESVAPTPDPTVAPADIPTDSPTPVPTDSPVPTQSPTPAPTETAPAPAPVPSDSTSPSASPSASPSKLPPHAIANQTMTIRTPNVVTVDPRARSVYLPQIAAYGVENLLVCISSSQVSFDVSGQNQTDPKKGTLISGDQSTFLRASGLGSSPIALINGQNGMRAISLSGGIANKFLNLSFVALSEPSLNPALCGDGSPSNNRTMSIQSMGLNVDMLKGNVTLKK
jgi:hypothetical protein